MSKANDLISRRFGRLLVLARIKNTLDGHTRWLCKCDCGKIVEKTGRLLLSGKSKSCGCYKQDKCRYTHTIHGLSKDRHPTKEYHIWANMKQRCYNKKCKSYVNYGARGITVCERWRESPENFLKDMGPRPYGYTLERIDNDGNYEPSNCKWSSRTEQSNNRRNNILIEHNNKTQSLKEWSNETGIKRDTLYARIFRLNWKINDALTWRKHEYYSRKHGGKRIPEVPWSYAVI